MSPRITRRRRIPSAKRPNENRAPVRHADLAAAWQPAGFGFAALRAYLAVFAAVAPNQAHARVEHRLIEGSIVDAYAYHRERGASSRRAAYLAAREHISELQPLAVVQKTRHDAGYAPRSTYPYWSRLAAAPVGFFLIVGVAFGVWSMAGSAEAGTPPLSTPAVHGVVRVFPEGHPLAGTFVEVGEFASEREALFVATDGKVCLPPETTAADFIEALPTVAPGDTEACADLRGRSVPQ